MSGSLSPSVPNDERTKHYPLRVANAVYARGGTVRSLPKPLDTFPRIMETEGMAFLFKPFGMDQLYRLLACHCPILLRRPFGWGIEMFAATFVARVAIAPPVPFDIFFVDECTMDSGVGLHEDTILLLDMRGADVEADVAVEADLDAALTKYVHRRCQQHVEHYGMSDIPSMKSFLGFSSPAAKIITYTANESHRHHLPMILLIENFDDMQAPAAESVVDTFFHELEHIVVTARIKGLVLFSDMYDEKPPVPNLQHAIDITHHPAFQTAVGCTEQDVRDLNRALAKSFPESPGYVSKMLVDKALSPLFFAHEDWDQELQPSHPLRVAELDMSEAHRGVYPLEPVLEVLTEQYSLRRT
ncbi:hypothetical protein FB45DRAFT_915506 [Roridomyces roridus]|uniref:Uncharacterized protein n=1 Tax=Roridomyces roridus TaxID=1738132 RepID=A0AAD7BTS3_9AGAR|nr:hypothetical protein FB45DRAFT_915506 [Roridomyces roridus]